jgi:hypothetical protein
MMPLPNRRSVETDAWTAYNRAFRDFSEKVRMVQTKAANPKAPRAEIEAALLAMEKARLAYSSARDALARQLLKPQRKTLPEAAATSPVHTAEVAELLWESVGRPEGTAQADWYRAEEIIRMAREEVFQP